jgi:hypothetical protein
MKRGRLKYAASKAEQKKAKKAGAILPKFCPQCKTDGRQVKIPAKSKFCDDCALTSKRASKAKYARSARAKVGSEAAHIAIDRISQDESSNLCRCGCGGVVVHPNKYTDACRETSQAEIYAAALERCKNRPKPVKPVPIMTTAEQMRIDSEQRQREEQQHAATMAEFGLIVAPGRPIASTGRLLTAEEIAEAQSQYVPPVKTPFYATTHSCSWELPGGHLWI